MKKLHTSILATVGALSLSAFTQANAQLLIAGWNFDNLTAATTNLNPIPSGGANQISASSSSVGMTSTGTANFPTTNATGPDTSNIYNIAGTDTDNSGAGNKTWRLVGTNGWNSGTGIGTQGAQFNVDTTGFNNIKLTFDLMITTQGEANMQVEYSSNGGSSWFNAPITYSGAGASILTNTTATNPNLVNGTYFHGTATTTDTWFNNITANLSSVSAVNSNTNVELRIVNAATGASCVNLKTNGALNNTSGNWRLDDVQVSGIPEPSTWAMMIAGFMLLVGYQIRRSRSNGL